MRSRTLVHTLLFCLLTGPGPDSARGQTSDDPHLGIYYRAGDRSSRVAELGETLTVTVYLSHRGDQPQTYFGRVADDEGRLVLSGAWALFVDEERLGRVIASRRLAGPEVTDDAEPRTLEVGGRHEWKIQLPVAELADHAGNYRLRVRLGTAEKSGQLLRVAESRATPEWIALEYAPEKRNYRIGEPINVHFTLRNDGEDDFPYEHGGDYRGANRHLRFAFTAESRSGDRAVDPRPSQACLGGMGSADARLEPGATYETDLPLLAYLTFPGPGIYTVTAYQDLGFGLTVPDLEETGWHQGHAYGGTFEVEIAAPEPQSATAEIRAALETDDEYERRRRLSFLGHPAYLEPLAAVVDDQSAAAGEVIRAIGEIFTVEATRKLLALARHPRAAVRTAALQELLDRRPVPEDPGLRSTPITFHQSSSRRRQVMELWAELGLAELWSVFEAALGSGDGREAALGGSGILARGDADDFALLVRAAERLAPELPLTEEQRAAVARLGNTAFSFAWFFGAPPVAVDETSVPGRLVVWANMLRPAAPRLGPVEEELLLRMLHSEETLLRHNAIRWLPEGFSRGGEIPWRALLSDEDRSIWWYAVQAAKVQPEADVELLVRELLTAAESDKLRDFEELLAILSAR